MSGGGQFVLLGRRGLCVLLAACVAGTPGCGAILFPTYQEVEVTCTNVPTALFAAPKRGLSVRSGGVLTLDRREDYVIVVSAPGYRTQEVRVEGELSIWRASVSVVLNLGHGLFTLFITTVLGIGADLKQGAWLCVEDTPVEVELVPGEDGPASSGGQIAPVQPTVASPAPASPAPSAYCTSCGAKAGSSNFCTSCGAKVKR